MKSRRSAAFSPTSAHDAALDWIELRHLEQISEIVDTGGFSSAARRLNQTQPALSKSIARLEGQLGVRLFERSTCGVQPTQFGRLLADKGRVLLEGVAELEKELTLLAAGGPGRLRIGVGPATRLKPLPQVVKAVLARFPGIQLEIRQELAPSLPRGAEDGRFDVVFLYCEGAEPHGDLMRVKIFEDRQVVAVRPEHPLATSRGVLSVAELMDHPWASWGSTPSFRRWSGPLSSVQARNAEAFASDDLEIVVQTAATADYIARGPQFLFTEALAAGALVELSTSYTSKYECWMLTTAERWRSPLIKAVAELAKSSVQGASGTAYQV